MNVDKLTRENVASHLQVRPALWLNPLFSYKIRINTIAMSFGFAEIPSRLEEDN